MDPETRRRREELLAALARRTALRGAGAARRHARVVQPALACAAMQAVLRVAASRAQR